MRSCACTTRSTPTATGCRPSSASSSRSSSPRASTTCRSSRSRCGSDAPERGAYELERVAHAAEVEIKRVPGTREVQTLGGPGRAVRACCSMRTGWPRTAFPRSTCATRCNRERGRAGRQAGARQPRDRGRDRQLPGDRPPTWRELVVGVLDGRPVFMSDVAEVGDGPDQPARYVWTGAGAAAKTRGIAVGGEHPAVTLAGHQEARRERGRGRRARAAARAEAARHGHPARRAGHGDAQLRRDRERQGAAS